MASSGLIPKGDPVTKAVPALPPSPTKHITNTLSTTHSSATSISLVPLDVSHAPDLLVNVGGLQNDHLYTYMPDGPFHTLDEMEKHITLLLGFPGWFSYAIFSSSPAHLSNSSSKVVEGAAGTATAIGIICLLNMRPAHLSVEIGHVLFCKTLQRTSESTMINYLLMRLVFEECGYERVEWKCNTHNAPSKRAAERLGFKAEGVFRRHMVLKGVWRDTVSSFSSCSFFAGLWGVGMKLRDGWSLTNRLLL